MPAPTITLVHTQTCHFCADAQNTLNELATQHPIQIDPVDADSDAGQDLIGRHRPAMFPLVLIDGVFFSIGRLPRRKLQALLAARTAQVPS